VLVEVGTDDRDLALRVLPAGPRLREDEPDVLLEPGRVAAREQMRGPFSSSTPE
jgi:hypothetical protein